MELSADEKAALDSLFVEILADAQTIGCEAMESLFRNYSETKSYFTHMDVSPGSKDMRLHGEKIIHTINDALIHHDNMQENLGKLRELHSDKLALNVDTIQLLCQCLMDVIVKHFPDADLSACEKFLNMIADSLITS
ncbi:hemoglobin heart muscle subunit alpha-type-like [Leptodactylus fuscus]|uniref:hemoglobin heart muscle subunit alpha-type-like n=1 Tax=Leptodactylus fuscus TaxID=238119 RepID=UPI003F4E827E